MPTPRGNLAQSTVDVPTDPVPAADLGIVPTIVAPPSRSSVPEIDGGKGAFDAPSDRFVERRELGRGGMGRVIEADDRALQRPVAIKYMLSDGGADLARFEREARLTALLEHPGIVSVHDAGRTVDGTPYYVMQRIDGRPLSEVIEGRTPRERLELVPRVLAACDAIAYAHSRNVIHRDLKPANILLGAFGETLVIDWGLARAIGETDAPSVDRPSAVNLTRVGSVAGTPGFMSPEQARGESLDASVDVYALGATLFYLLAGAPPYTTASATEMISLAGENRPPDWTLLPLETPSDLRAILVKAMASRREERYRDAGELAADLGRFVSGQMVGAHDYGWFEQVRLFVRRHRAAVAVAAVAAVLLTAGGAYSLRKVVTERDHANAARQAAETARRETDEQRDALLVQHAQTLATRDPVASIAVLRRLRAKSRQWRLAASAAGAAATRGIPVGFSSADGARLQWMSWSPRSQRLAIFPGPSWGRRTTATDASSAGELVILEVPGYERRRIAVPPGTLRGAWIDDGLLVAVTDTDDALLVDLAVDRARPLVLSAKVKDLASDDATGLWLLLADGTLRRVDRSGTLGPVLGSEVRALDPLPGGGVVVSRASGREVRKGVRTWPLDVPAGATIVPGGGGVIATQHDRQLCRFKVGDELVAEACLNLLPEEYVLSTGPDGHFVASAGSMTLIGSRGGRRSLSRSWSAIVATPIGVVYAHEGTELVIAEAGRQIRLSSRGQQYRQLAQSSDGRWLSALTVTGDLMVWPIDVVRPTVVPLTQGAKLVGATADRLYEVHLDEFALIDRSTGERRVLHRGPFLATSGFVRSQGGQWLLGRGIEGTSFAVHLPSETLWTAHEGETFTITGAGLDVWTRGKLSRLEPDGRRAPVVELPDAVRFDSNGRTAVGMTEDRRMCRVSILGGPITCATHPSGADVDALAIDDDGTVWSISKSRLWRWDVGGAILMVRPDFAVTNLYRFGGQLYGVSTDAIVPLSADPDRTFGVPTLRQLWPAPDQYILLVTQANELQLMDALTGSSYELPGGASIMLSSVTFDGNVLTWGDMSYAYRYTLPAPTDPTALQHWLKKVTNAIPIADSDALAWPAL